MSGGTAAWPKPMAAISDSSPLILFAAIDRLDLIPAVLGEILVPPAVWREVVVAVGEGRVGARVVRRAPRLRRSPLPPTPMLPAVAALDQGEAEVLHLALSIKDDGVIVRLEDLRARRVARDLGLVVTGSGGLLGRAKEAGLIPAARPLLEELRAAGLFLGEAAMRDLLRTVGE